MDRTLQFSQDQEKSHWVWTFHRAVFEAWRKGPGIQIPSFTLAGGETEVLCQTGNAQGQLNIIISLLRKSSDLNNISGSSRSSLRVKEYGGSDGAGAESQQKYFALRDHCRLQAKTGVAEINEFEFDWKL